MAEATVDTALWCNISIHLLLNTNQPRRQQTHKLRKQIAWTVKRKTQAGCLDLNRFTSNTTATTTAAATTAGRPSPSWATTSPAAGTLPAAAAPPPPAPWAGAGGKEEEDDQSLDCRKRSADPPNSITQTRHLHQSIQLDHLPVTSSGSR